ncbi:MAG TPA: hypothetical protein VGE52_16405 [Pirellulales bacterium]
MEDVVCTQCGCLCDDLSVEVAENRVVRVSPACPKAERWLKAGESPLEACRVDGRPAAFEAGIARAAELLRNARAPLVFGLLECDSDGQRAAVALADRIGATIDVTGDDGGPLAMSQLGGATCTLGEVRHRADVVLIWNCDPIETHPRFFERFLDPPGRFVPEGRAGRTVMLVSSQEAAATRGRADLVATLTAGANRDYDALWTLRALLKGIDVNAQQVERRTGVSLDVWKQISDRMRTAKYSAVLVSEHLAEGTVGRRNMESLLAWNRDLNVGHARSVLVPMSPFGNALGARLVLSRQTGFPQAVNLGPGGPRSFGREFGGPETLARGAADAAVIVGNVRGTDFSPATLERLKAIPTIVVETASTDARFRPAATVSFAAAEPGRFAPGVAYRLDDVALPLSAPLASNRPTIAAVLERLIAAL